MQLGAREITSRIQCCGFTVGLIGGACSPDSIRAIRFACHVQNRGLLSHELIPTMVLPRSGSSFRPKSTAIHSIEILKASMHNPHCSLLPLTILAVKLQVLSSFGSYFIFYFSKRSLFDALGNWPLSALSDPISDGVCIVLF